jgi:thioredoxin-dependent peroxiredoxin
MVGVDEEAPGLLLVATDGQTMDLGAPSERLVLFFCEDVTTGRAASTAGDFNDQLTEFRQLGVRVIGVGVEPEKIVASFATAHDLRYPLVSDADRRVCLSFGLVGTKRGRPRATTVMIDTTGLVKRVFADVPPYGHARDVLEEARQMWGTY